MKSFNLAILLVFATKIQSHLLLSYPPALRYIGNTYITYENADYSLTSPLNSDGSNFPCKGYQSDLGSLPGTSVATWDTGSLHNFTLLGSATHNGGSCQASISYDSGKTFTVLNSYIGGCPILSPPGGSFDFQIPSDAPTGNALFAWTWFNSIGNREMYMNCASVTINGGTKGETPSIPFSSRPLIFVANVGNGCETIANTDISFPNPGPDLTNVTTHAGGVTGFCEAR